MSLCRAQWAFLILVVVLGSIQMLASCGQKGDLYLPERETPEQGASVTHAEAAGVEGAVRRDDVPVSGTVRLEQSTQESESMPGEAVVR